MEEQHLVSWSQRNATKGEAMPILLIFGFISLIGVVLLLALSLLIGFITAPLRTLALVIDEARPVSSRWSSYARANTSVGVER